MLTIVGIVAIIVITINVYRTARGTGRNAALWAAFCAVLGFSFHFVLPVGFVISYATYLVVTGANDAQMNDALSGPTSIAGILGVIGSIVGMVMIAKHVARVPDDPAQSGNAPPPPPRFEDRI